MRPRPRTVPPATPANVLARRLQPRIPAWVTERMRAPLPSPFHGACARPRYRRWGRIARGAAGPALPPALGEGRAGASRAQAGSGRSGVLWVRPCGPAGKRKAEREPCRRGIGSVSAALLSSGVTLLFLRAVLVISSSGRGETS